jgi:regulator of protease activity HflC (stomatin/prohibitin superfamily)
MNGWIVFLLVAVPVLAVVLWMLLDESIVKIEPGELGLVLVHGKATDKALDPGVHWVPAFRRRIVQVYPSLELSYRAGAAGEGTDALERGGPPVAVVLGDRTTASASYTVRFRLDPARLRLVHERFGPDGIWSAVRDLSARAVRSAVNDPTTSIDDLFGPARHALDDRLHEAVATALAVDGLEVTMFQLDEVDAGRSADAIQAAVRARLELEREQAESPMRQERARRDAEIAGVLGGVDADPALRYREADAWRELVAELARRAPMSPPRSDAGRAERAERAEAAVEESGAAE